MKALLDDFQLNTAPYIVQGLDFIFVLKNVVTNCQLLVLNRDSFKFFYSQLQVKDFLIKKANCANLLLSEFNLKCKVL